MDLRISQPPQTPSKRETAASAKAWPLLQVLVVVVLSSVTSCHSSRLFGCASILWFGVSLRFGNHLFHDWFAIEIGIGFQKLLPCGNGARRILLPRYLIMPRLKREF